MQPFQISMHDTSPGFGRLDGIRTKVDLSCTFGEYGALKPALGLGLGQQMVLSAQARVSWSGLGACLASAALSSDVRGV